MGFDIESEQERKDKDALIYEKTVEMIERWFDSALVGRLRNDIIIFRTLGRHEASKVLDLMLENVRRKVDGRVGSRSIPLMLHFSPAFKDFLLDEGHDLLYGLRPLRKTVERFVTVPIANGIANGQLKEADEVFFTVDGEGPDRTPVLRRKIRPEPLRVTDEEERTGRTTVPMEDEGAKA